MQKAPRARRFPKSSSDVYLSGKERTPQMPKRKTNFRMVKIADWVGQKLDAMVLWRQRLHR